MKEEMIRLNRVKYAHSEEERNRLLSEGYQPVEEAEPDGGQEAESYNSRITDKDNVQEAEPDGSQKPDKRGAKEK
ncbi:MAG: hypothetical protein NC489_42075 [Ruminococcus flavefaciens]|nr:hypothetical protein [Eubacterium sp.]MCM1236709.1 hypothetical protein [Ruminococcus flavefaciens]